MSDAKGGKTRSKRTTPARNESAVSEKFVKTAAVSRIVNNDSAAGRAVTKARRTVTLDMDVVAELESRDGSVSAQLNEWARRGMEWDQRQAQILELVAEYEAEFGEIDEADVKRWEEVLS